MGGAGDRYTTEAWLCPLTVPASVPALARLPLAYLRPAPDAESSLHAADLEGRDEGPRLCRCALWIARAPRFLLHRLIARTASSNPRMENRHESAMAVTRRMHP